MSFNEVEYELNDRCYVIRGDNKDNAGQQSNGGGKTSFVDIIAVGILGTSLTKRNLKDCVNWKSEKGFFEVGIYMENQKDTVQIKRKVYSNTKSTELCILVNGKVPVTLPTKRGVENGVDIRAGNQYILEEILDITVDDLLNYYFISKSYEPFLAINTDKKLEVISRFTNSKVVDKAISKLEGEFKEIDRSIRDYEDKIATREGYIEGLLNSLNEEEFERNKQDKLSSLDSSIDLVENQIITLQRSIDRLQKEIEEIVLEDDKHQRYEELVVSAKKYCEEMDRIEGEIQENDEGISSLKSYFAGEVSCPKCSYRFNPKQGGDYTTEDLQALIELKEILTLQLDDYEKEHNLIVGELRLIEEINRSNDEKRRRITSNQKEIHLLQQRQVNQFNEIERLEGTKTQVSNQSLLEESGRINEKIEEKKGEIQAYQKKIDLLVKEKEETSQWIANFEDFKFYLGNKPLNLICSLVNQYLSLNDSDLNLYIEGFKKLRSGEIRQALNPVVYRNWMNPQRYEQFSGGEMVRLNISVDLAFQQLINSTSKTGGLGIYINDELLNPLDSLGVGNAAKAFDKLNKTILLVTHSGSDLVYDNTIVVQKENGISTVL